MSRSESEEKILKSESEHKDLLQTNSFTLQHNKYNM